MKTKQEIFWESDFGEKFHQRINTEQYLVSNINFFKKVLSYCDGIESITELGAGGGNNLKAIHKINNKIKLNAIEMFDGAYKLLRQVDFINSIKASIYDDFKIDQSDLVFTKTVLIHLKPEKLEIAYDKIYKLSNKYILVAEYFNPTPVTVNYRGHDDVLFKRDFAKEMLKKYDLEIIKYGFVWAQDPKYPLDDINWFLLKKNN